MRRPSRGGGAFMRPRSRRARPILPLRPSKAPICAPLQRRFAWAGCTGTRRPAKFQPRPVPAAIRSSPFCSTMKTNSSAPITILVHQLDSVPSNTM